MMDVTEVRAFLGGTFHVAGVFDAFSRVPLALQTYEKKPGAAAMARLLKAAARAFGKAKYLITDQGKEFDGRTFRQPLMIEDLEVRLETALTYYRCFRPHQGLRSATPAEAFLGLPTPEMALKTPRGRAGEDPSQSPFTIAFVNVGGSSFPILKKTA
jgi:transposase InsO family protein